MSRPGYVDPSLGKPETLKDRQIFDAVRARGLTLNRLHAGRAAVRLTGPGIHVTAASLSALTLQDLLPEQHRNPAP